MKLMNDNLDTWKDSSWARVCLICVRNILSKPFCYGSWCIRIHISVQTVFHLMKCRLLYSFIINIYIYFINLIRNTCLSTCFLFPPDNNMEIPELFILPVNAESWWYLTMTGALPKLQFARYKPNLQDAKNLILIFQFQKVLNHSTLSF